MDEKTIRFMRNVFKGYYFRHAESVEEPKRIEEREFGFIPFGGTMIRHIQYKSKGELIAMLVKEAPAGVYYSCAYYHEPALSMDMKGWKEADLAFDIDADTIPTPCKDGHDSWTCRNCGHSGRGLRPQGCLKCYDVRIQQRNWVCQLCLDAAKEELLKLKDFLLRDFGSKEGEIRTYFSGSKGFHVSVESEIFKELGQMPRSDIADYVSAVGLDFNDIGIMERGGYEDWLRSLPSTGDPGWRGRIARHLIKEQTEVLDDQSLKRKMLEVIEKQGFQGFRKVLGNVVEHLRVRIDPSVTTDVHRIFRLGGTLHRESGMLKKLVKNVEGFDPFSDPAVLGDEPVKVHVDYSPQFTLKGQVYGPYKDEKLSLPTVVAVYLLGRGMAEVIE